MFVLHLIARRIGSWPWRWLWLSAASCISRVASNAGARLGCFRHGHCDWLKLDVDRLHVECLACGRQSTGVRLDLKIGLGFFRWRPTTRPTSGGSA